MSTTSDATSTAQLVARYAQRFNAMYAGTHTVTSPLGAWLLLAVAAPASEGDVRRRLEAVLGCTVDDASARASALLRTVHPAVSSAAAIWAQPAFMTEGFAAFSARIPADVERGPIPTQSQADRWASDHTNGMIPSFPVSVDEMSALLLATAVATDVSWVVPFEAVPAAHLGGRFSASITTALASPADHAQFLASTPTAGIVAVHVAAAAAGLDVVSILAGESVEPADVHAAAHEVAAMVSGGPSAAERLSLFDLPTGAGAAWTITETEEVRFAMRPRAETYATWLAAWKAADTHHILGAPGFPELCETFAALLKPELVPPSFEAAQSAIAQYTRTGFRAAAVTGFGMRAGAVAQEMRVVHRHAEIRFNRPYAVVAVATDRTVDESGRRVRLAASPWTGLPVFSAWVARPENA